MGQDQAVRTLFVTLRRSVIGKPWFHRRVVESLGLRKRLMCVEKPNSPIIRGMLRRVAHLVVVETDAMFYGRKVAEYEAAKLRPPVTIKHALSGSSFAAGPAVAAAAAATSGSGSKAAARLQQQQQQQQPPRQQQQQPPRQQQQQQPRQQQQL